MDDDGGAFKSHASQAVGAAATTTLWRVGVAQRAVSTSSTGDHCPSHEAQHIFGERGRICEESGYYAFVLSTNSTLIKVTP